MNVDVNETERFLVALELFKEGQCLTFDSVDYCLISDGTLSVSIQSSWQMENTSSDRALVDLERGQANLAYLIENCEQFAAVVLGLEPCFSLTDSYGTGTVEWGRFIDGKIVWNPGHPLFVANASISN